VNKEKAKPEENKDRILQKLSKTAILIHKIFLI